MFGFGIRTWQNATGSPRSADSPNSAGSPRPAGTPRSTASPKAEVGEIDTRAPFRSVKAALSLFVEAGSSPRNTPVHKRSQSIEERVLEKETQHHLTIKELENLKEHLRNTEVTKSQALAELDKANRTVEKLTNKLETLSESKQAAFMATEAAKKRHKELEERISSKAQVGADAWKMDVDNVRDQYKASAAQLIFAKQELTNLRQDFDAALEAKLTAFQKAADAQHTTQVNQGKVGELSKKISSMRETLSQVKGASIREKEQHVKLIAEKEAHIHSYKTSKEEIDKRSRSLNHELQSGLNENFEEKLEETNETITVLQEQLNNIRSFDQNSLRSVTSELDTAKKKLQEILSEENSVRSVVDSLSLELENMKRDRYEIEKAALEAESAAESLQFNLESDRKELDALNAGEVKLKDDSDDSYLTIHQLSSEAEVAWQEAEELKKNIVLVMQEAEIARVAAKEIEEQLQVALKEVEEAKAAEKLADDKIHNSSAGHATSSESSGKIILSAEEYESLRKKAEQSKSDADIKVATARAQVESIRASENEALGKLEASLKENEDLRAAIEHALKQAEMAEAAKKVVEGELRKWREKELNDRGEPSNIEGGTE